MVVRDQRLRAQQNRRTLEAMPAVAGAHILEVGCAEGVSRLRSPSEEATFSPSTSAGGPWFAPRTGAQRCRAFVSLVSISPARPSSGRSMSCSAPRCSTICISAVWTSARSFGVCFESGGAHRFGPSRQGCSPNSSDFRESHLAPHAQRPNLDRQHAPLRDYGAPESALGPVLKFC